MSLWTSRAWQRTLWGNPAFSWSCLDNHFRFVQLSHTIPNRSWDVNNLVPRRLSRGSTLRVIWNSLRNNAWGHHFENLGQLLSQLHGGRGIENLHESIKNSCNLLLNSSIDKYVQISAIERRTCSEGARYTLTIADASNRDNLVESLFSELHAHDS